MQYLIRCDLYLKIKDVEAVTHEETFVDEEDNERTDDIKKSVSFECQISS